MLRRISNRLPVCCCNQWDPPRPCSYQKTTQALAPRKWHSYPATRDITLGSPSPFLLFPLSQPHRQPCSQKAYTRRAWRYILFVQTLRGTFRLGFWSRTFRSGPRPQGLWGATTFLVKAPRPQLITYVCGCKISTTVRKNTKLHKKDGEVRVIIPSCTFIDSGTDTIVCRLSHSARRGISHLPLRRLLNSRSINLHWLESLLQPPFRNLKSQWIEFSLFQKKLQLLWIQVPIERLFNTWKGKRRKLSKNNCNK